LNPAVTVSLAFTVFHVLPSFLSDDVLEGADFVGQHDLQYIKVFSKLAAAGKLEFVQNGSSLQCRLLAPALLHPIVDLWQPFQVQQDIKLLFQYFGLAQPIGPPLKSAPVSPDAFYNSVQLHMTQFQVRTTSVWSEFIPVIAKVQVCSVAAIGVL
jgi:hypothetical protein